MFDTKNQRNETCVLTENRKELTEEKQYFFFDKMRAFLVMTVFIQATFGLLDIAQNVCDFGEHNQLKCFMRTLQSDGINQVNSILNDIEKLNIVSNGAQKRGNKDTFKKYNDKLQYWSIELDKI